MTMVMPLTTTERDLLIWLLPESRIAYQPYRECVLGWSVVARGQRGEGHLVMAVAGRVADLDMPLPHAVAYGIVQTSAGDIAVTIRERSADQLECDISNLSGGSLPSHFLEKRRWSYSLWSPGMPCPQCGTRAREVRLPAGDTVAGVLALCRTDRRLWLYDSSRAIALPVPLTSFYAELMRVRGIRDPHVALDPHRLYAMLESYTDGDLAAAFFQYNKLKPKLTVGEVRRPTPARRPSVFRFVRTLLGKSPS